MSFLDKIFGRQDRPKEPHTTPQVNVLFSGFSVSEKRELSNLSAAYLSGEKARRAGKVVVVDIGGNPALVQRLSDQELTCLMEAREAMRKADATNGSQAIALYQKAAELAPWDEIAVMSIGVEYAQAGNYAKGIQWLEKALALNPSNQRVRSNLEGVKRAAAK